MRLNDAERAAFARDGYLVRERAFAEPELEALRTTIEAMVARVVAHARRPEAKGQVHLADGHRLQFSARSAIQWEWREGSPDVRLMEPFTHLDPAFAPLWTDARFVDPARDMLGVDAVAPFTCKLNLKRPREGSQFPWHQDYPYWYVRTPEHAHEIVTAILFVDDARAVNGALRVLPGSHRGGPAPRDRNEPTRFLADAAQLDLTSERLIAASAGSVLFFPSLLVHRSAPNASDRQRRAMLLSFQPGGRPRQQELEWRPERVEELP